MASAPIIWWQIDWEIMKTVTDFILGAPKTTTDGDCSHDIKRRLLLGRKVLNNLYSVLKSRDITLPTEVGLVKDTVFPVVMYGCLSWTIKKTEPWIIYAFELCCWRVPWTASISNQSILKGNQPWIFIWRIDAEAETPIRWPPDAKNWLFWKDPDAGKDWRLEKRTTEDEMVEWHQWTWVWVIQEVGDGQGGLAYCSSWDHKQSDTTEQLNWTDELFSL